MGRDPSADRVSSDAWTVLVLQMIRAVKRNGEYRGANRKMRSRKMMRKYHHTLSKQDGLLHVVGVVYLGSIALLLKGVRSNIAPVSVRTAVTSGYPQDEDVYKKRRHVAVRRPGASGVKVEIPKIQRHKGPIVAMIKQTPMEGVSQVLLHGIPGPHRLSIQFIQSTCTRILLLIVLVNHPMSPFHIIHHTLLRRRIGQQMLLELQIISLSSLYPIWISHTVITCITQCLNAKLLLIMLRVWYKI
mmetsp:Transcript_6758/g.10175  ORF Transcript_6758/g.10175 Transcript_6758/m.10175 type:complete len:244 (+) Transcript_6758:729-1460(+)